MKQTIILFNTILNNRLFYTLTIMLLITSSCSDDFDSTQQESADIGLEIETRSTTELCLTTMNTFLLDTPDILGNSPQCNGADCLRRARLICDLIDLSFDSDVVMLQEVWVEEAGELLIDCMVSKGYVFHTGFDGDSGLITFSKHEITL